MDPNDNTLLKSRSKFQRYNSFPEDVAFKLIAQSNNLEIKEIWLFLLTSPTFLFKELFLSRVLVFITLAAKLSFPLALLSIASNICRLWLTIPICWNSKYPPIIPGFQNKSFNPNYTKKRETGRAGVGRKFDFTVNFWKYLGNEKFLKAKVFWLSIFLPLVFSKAKICWNQQMLSTPK